MRGFKEFFYVIPFGHAHLFLSTSYEYWLSLFQNKQTRGSQCVFITFTNACRVAIVSFSFSFMMRVWKAVISNLNILWHILSQWFSAKLLYEKFLLLFSVWFGELFFSAVFAITILRAICLQNLYCQHNNAGTIIWRGAKKLQLSKSKFSYKNKFMNRIFFPRIIIKRCLQNSVKIYVRFAFYKFNYINFTKKFQLNVCFKIFFVYTLQKFNIKRIFFWEGQK